MKKCKHGYGHSTTCGNFNTNKCRACKHYGILGDWKCWYKKAKLTPPVSAGRSEAWRN